MRRLFFVADDAEEVVKFAGCQVYLFVVIEVVHLLDFDQKLFLELCSDDRSDLQQEVELSNEVFPEHQLPSRHVILDDIEESAVYRVHHESLVLEASQVQVKL